MDTKGNVINFCVTFGYIFFTFEVIRINIYFLEKDNC